MFNDISLDIFWLYMKYNTRNISKFSIEDGFNFSMFAIYQLSKFNPPLNKSYLYLLWF